MQNVGMYIYIFIHCEEQDKATRTEQCMDGHHGYSASQVAPWQSLSDYSLLDHPLPCSSPLHPPRHALIDMTPFKREITTQ